MPASAVEFIKVIAPMELELVSLAVIVVDLDVVVENVPWHIGRIEVMTPGVKRRRPEVHPERLRLMHTLNCGVVLVGRMPDLMTVNGPAHIVWRPLHLVHVPVIFGIEPVGVLVRFNLVVAIAIDHVH